MTFFRDLSDYVYWDEPTATKTLNVGWLERSHEFDVWSPDVATLDILWAHCQILINETRGLHKCEFCVGAGPIVEEREGKKRLLGSAEIRVVASDGTFFAAPNLIYHYVSAHNYKPPAAFLLALRDSMIPLGPSYFAALDRVGCAWGIAEEQ